jgi:Arf-GAP with SH3 domain, ANK repeat and PH domain-containing protein
LTTYADGQAKSFLGTAKKVEALIPQLDALVKEVGQADKEYQLQRTEREEKRRNLERSTPSYTDTENVLQHAPPVQVPQSSHATYTSETELSRADSTGSQLGRSLSTRSSVGLSPSDSLSHAHASLSHSLSGGGSGSSPAQNRFKGIRDLEERDSSMYNSEKTTNGAFRKEGLLWALSRPGSHIDPKGINKQAWHK